MRVSIPDAVLLLSLKNLPIRLFKRAALLSSHNCLNGSNYSFIYVVASEDLPQAYMPDTVKRLLEVYKLLNRSRLCCKRFSVMTRLLKISFTVLLPGLKPACSSVSSSSALGVSRLRIAQNMILLGWLIRLMV